MSVSDFFVGIRDLLSPKEIARDLLRIAPGIRDLIESLWNEEGVLRRNAEQTFDRVPTTEDLSYFN